MAPNRLLPFKVGEQAESKSFLKGFRSAWFRCKIKKLGHTKDSVKALLEFYDYPGEKMHWTQLYQKCIRLMDEQKPQLILRPCFPPWYRENQMPDPCTISDLIVIVDDVWMVGDLVDWWSDGCYWSGRVTHLLGKDKVQVTLPDPPIGEGKSYEAFCNDLRPSLNWSLEHGWTVPGSETSRRCARLVQPLRKDKGGNKNCTVASNTTDNGQDTCKLEEHGGGPASCDTWTSVSSSAHAGSLLSPSGYIDPHVNKKSRRSSERVDNVREIEVQSTEVRLGLDVGRKEIANSFCMVSSSLTPPSGYINPGVNNALYKGREETEDGTEVQSINMNLTLDDGVTTNSLGKASSAHASSSSIQVGHMTPEPGSKENEYEMEIQSTNMIMDSENSWRGTTNRFDKASTAPACTLLPSTGYTSPKINGRSTQGSGRENTEEEEVQSTSIDFGSVCDRRGTTSTLQKASSILASSYLHLELNEISRPVSGREETEGNREIQSMAMSLESDDSRRKITSSLEISGQRPGRKENEKIEVQSTDMNLNSDASRRGTINRLDQDSGTSSIPSLLPVRCLSPEIGETSMQSSGMEETKQRAAVDRTGMKLDSYVVGKQTTGMVDKLSLSPGASLLPRQCHNPEINDTFMLGMGKTERNADLQMLNINLDSEYGRRLPTNFLDRASRSHEMNTPMDVTKVSCGKDPEIFCQFRKRSRINETHHPTSVTELNSIESSILELEELANKIKWIKRLIIYGIQWSTMKPSWKFSET